jgi:hypothetical protein
MPNQHQLRFQIIAAAMIVAAIFLSTSSSGAGHGAFQYPPPPKEGKGGFFTIAEDGKPRCVIVKPVRKVREIDNACQILKTYLDLSTGASFEIISERDASGGLGEIHVGDTREALKTDLALPKLVYNGSEFRNINGYLVTTPSSDVLVIRGETPLATVSGVAGFLKRYAGIRRYWPDNPGGLGDVVPQRRTFRLPQIEWRDWPYFVSLVMSTPDTRGPQGPLSRTVRFSYFWRFHYTIPSNESYYRLMRAVDNIGRKELFPLINGKRFIPEVYTRGTRKTVRHGWQPCVSNPEVARIMAESIVETFTADKDKIAESLSVNDGYGECHCENCKALDLPTTDINGRVDISDRYIRFNNRVAEKVYEKHPDRLLAFLGYGPVRQPPKTVKPHPMLMPVYVGGENTFEVIDRWAATGIRHMGMYYHHHGYWRIMPMLYSGLIKRRIDYLVQTDLGRHFYMEYAGNYPLECMVGHTISELTWDPRTDPDALLDEYCRLFFGPASAEMKEFHHILERGFEAYLEANGTTHPFGRDLMVSLRERMEQFEVLPPASSARALSRLGAALERVPADSVFHKRISIVQSVFTLAHHGTVMHHATENVFRGSQNDNSKLSPNELINEASKAIKANRELTAFKHSTIEGKTPGAYADFDSRRGLYRKFIKGDLLPEVLSRLVTGLENNLTKQPDAWWRNVIAAEDDPVLQQIYADVRKFNLGGTIENRAADPGFEQSGPAGDLADDAIETKTGRELVTQFRSQGVTLFQSPGTPFRCNFSDQEKHGGKYSFSFWGTQSGSVIKEARGIKLESGDRLRCSLWYKRNAGAGNYSVHMIARDQTGGIFSRTVFNLEESADRWNQFMLYYIVPQGAKQVSMLVVVKNQERGARFYVDDFFIGKYPN